MEGGLGPGAGCFRQTQLMQAVAAAGLLNQGGVEKQSLGKGQVYLRSRESQSGEVSLTLALSLWAGAEG